MLRCVHGTVKREILLLNFDKTGKKEVFMLFTHPVARFTIYLAWIFPFAAQAEGHWYSYDHLYFQAGSYVHFHSDDDFAGNRLFASLEAIKSNNWLYGLALFNNSFDQFSQYLYGGKIFNFHGRLDGIHAKITAGLLHGYKGDFKDRVPYNNAGVSPAVIPGIGYKDGRFGADAFLLGFSGVLFTVGMEF